MAAQAETSSFGNRDAVYETVNRISAEALSLLAQRSEINRQIRALQQFLHSLGAPTTKTPQHMRSGAETEWSPGENGSLSRRTSPHGRSRSRHLTKHVVARLRRACRIALLEAGGIASLDEIRILIARRGSFVFVGPGSSNSALLRTLIQMGLSGEVRCLANHPESVWAQIVPSGEADLSS